MRNKKIITLLLAATVAITSVAPSIQVKATEIILVPSGNGGYTVSTATGSSVSTATPVPTETATETPVSNRDEKRWYSYRGIKYWMNNASGSARVIDKCLCGKRVVKMSRAAIRKHIDECIKTGGHPKSTKNTTVSASNVKGTASYVGQDVIETPEDYDGSEYKNRKDIYLFFDSDSAIISGLPVKKGTKVTFKLKGNRKYTTKVIVEKLYCKKSNGASVKVPTKTVRYDYLERNAKCIMKYSIWHKSTKKYTDHTKKFSNSKKAEKFAKKHNAEIVSTDAIGKEKLTVKIKGYGTYVFRVDFNTSPCGNSYKIADLRNK